MEMSEGALPPPARPAGAGNADLAMNAAAVEDAPSSFSRIPLPENDNAPLKAELESSGSPSKKKRGPKAGERDKSEADPVDQAEVAKANLAAAPIVGVVGYGPGDGGGSGIRRHTPSCDFCKRKSPLYRAVRTLDSGSARSD